MKKINILIKKHKKLIALFLVASFLMTVPYMADRYYARSAADKKQEAEENLKDVQNQMNKLEDKKDEVEGELKDVRKQLSKLMDKQNSLKSEIKSTQESLDATQADLETARQNANDQYEAMKLRIKYMYENGSGDSMLTAILESDGIADMLNRVEYVSTIYEYDRELTEQYKETIAQVEQKEQELLSTMDDLMVKQETFLGQQSEIEGMIGTLEDVEDEYKDQLASAKKQADEYKLTIQQQEEIIRKEQEEIRKKQEQQGENTYPGGKDVSGETLVNYALQFVGNPYVWGGNSLTNGCDCSGFVHEVYEYFGYDLVRYSLSFLYEGVEVSKDEMKPGDIVVYPRNSQGIGHVAIYIGNGKIVEAQSTSAGITCTRSVFYKEPLGIRRVLPNP